MVWSLELSKSVKKQLDSLDAPIQKRITKYLDERIANCVNPRHFGKSLSHSKSDLWCYRIGDYRVICELRDKEVIVLVVTIGHRRDVYND